jgi:hypothetical protein
MNAPMPITVETKVAALLEAFPELEEVLIGMAPPFKRLRNPILRRSVARVASLGQAASVGRISAHLMVNELRAMVGQPPLAPEDAPDRDSYFSDRPEWFDEGRVTVSLDEQDVPENVMPLKPLILGATRLPAGEILELVTTYLPAPGIDIMRGKGFSTWTVEEGETIRTYFTKAARTE